ncbi:hypothetical protein [Chromobacterium violaceum]|uniref:hypothetical protein n=1 Tax=Chromobacterium violaceum TaxID=536 RepID=UPI000AD52089|nr:hypothetical protein [Chromobacterium violaceum]
MPTFSSALLKPISSKLIEAFAHEGVHIGPAKALEFILWCLGFWTSKLARDFKTPLAVTPGSGHVHDSLPQHLHLRLVIDRIKSVQKVDEWVAQRAASVTLEVVRSSGLHVNTLKVLFDPAYADSRDRIFKAMSDPDFPPTQATISIALGKLPALPAVSLAERLNWIGPALALNGTVSEMVARTPTFLWDEPSRELRETHLSLTDKVDWRDGKLHSAELGLGFCLVRQEQYKGRVYTGIISPAAHYHARDERGWSASAIGQSGSNDEARARSLATIIGKPVSSLPRLKICPVCLALYSDDLEDLHHVCDGALVDARRVLAGLRVFSESEKSTFTTEDLVAFLKQGVDGSPRVTNDIVESFLKMHRHTLRIRSIKGQWHLVRQSTPGAERERLFGDVVNHHSPNHAQ